MAIHLQPRLQQASALSSACRLQTVPTALSRIAEFRTSITGLLASTPTSVALDRDTEGTRTSLSFDATRHLNNFEKAMRSIHGHHRRCPTWRQRNFQPKFTAGDAWKMQVLLAKVEHTVSGLAQQLCHLRDGTACVEGASQACFEPFLDECLSYTKELKSARDTVPSIKEHSWKKWFIRASATALSFALVLFGVPFGAVFMAAILLVFALWETQRARQNAECNALKAFINELSYAISDIQCTLNQTMRAILEIRTHRIENAVALSIRIEHTTRERVWDLAAECRNIATQMMQLKRSFDVSRHLHTECARLQRLSANESPASGASLVRRSAPFALDPAASWNKALYRKPETAVSKTRL